MVAWEKLWWNTRLISKHITPAVEAENKQALEHALNNMNYGSATDHIIINWEFENNCVIPLEDHRDEYIVPLTDEDFDR